LTGQFPTTYDGFFLAYAESTSAVDYLIRTHGQDALVALISSYADGRTDDEAFEAAIGLDMAAFDVAWQADIGATAPVRRGPQPAPRGPQPPGWGTGDPTNPDVPVTPDGSPGAPGAPASPSGSPVAGTPSETPANGSDGSSNGWAIVAIVTGVLVIAAVILIVRRGSRSSSGTTP
jgi:hypothetical protein